MDVLAQITSEKHSNPIEFLNELRQTTEPIGGGMKYCDDGEYVEYDVAVEAVKKAQKQLIDKACEFIKNSTYGYLTYKNGDTDLDRESLADDFRKAMNEITDTDTLNRKSI